MSAGWSVARHERQHRSPPSRRADSRPSSTLGFSREQLGGVCRRWGWEADRRRGGEADRRRGGEANGRVESRRLERFGRVRVSWRAVVMTYMEFQLWRRGSTSVFISGPRSGGSAGVPLAAGRARQSLLTRSLSLRVACFRRTPTSRRPRSLSGPGSGRPLVTQIHQSPHS